MYINGNGFNNYKATKNFSYIMEHYSYNYSYSGHWVISIDHPDDNWGSGYQLVYTSTKNVNCPTEIKYDEWDNTWHYWWHRAQQNMLKCNESQGTVKTIITGQIRHVGTYKHFPIGLVLILGVGLVGHIFLTPVPFMAWCVFFKKF